MQNSVKQKLLLLVLLLLLVVAGVAVYQYLMAPPVAPVTPVTEEVRPKREILLYFATADGLGLESEVREIEDCLVEEECLKATVEALLAGPTTGLVPVLAAQARIQSVSVDGATATVSFSRELAAGHPGGSMTELLTVHALANTLAVNFPHIRQVRILIDGAPVETLKGHVDLREPIAADFEFGRLQTNAGASRPGGN